LTEVGPVQLRGFAHHEAVHAVVADHLVAVGRLCDHTAPTGGGLGALPDTDEAMVGRGDELLAVWAALQLHHVVSIVGVGGMGKTRLATEAAAGVVHRFADGAWWCDLAAATSPDAVAPIVLSALEAQQSPGRSGVESVVDSLAGRDALVVLDNCEHVLTTARDLVRAIRRSCRDVRLLITSREALGVTGEHLIAVSSLPDDDALALFVVRAMAARPDLSVGDTQRTLAGRICSRLDGIPLAIELGAARCRSMTVVEIDRLLHDRFRLLRSGRPSVERHRTLHAAVAWSYDLLEVDERDMFDRMAVIADGSYFDGLVAMTGSERRTDSITSVLEHPAGARIDRRNQRVVVGRERQAHRLSIRLPTARGAHDIREQKRHGARGTCHYRRLRRPIERYSNPRASNDDG
jgi:hypothetical protein